MNVVYGESCAKCQLNALCEHYKLMWTGTTYERVKAVCRNAKGQLWRPELYDTLPEFWEPNDWYLWTLYGTSKLKTKRGIIYGREQFILEDAICVSITEHSPKNSKPVHKVIPSTEPTNVVKPLAGLKTVYTETSSVQGELF